MKKAKLDLKSLTPLQKVSKARTIAQAMNLSIVTFPSPNPTLATILAKAQELENAITAAADGSNSAQTTLEAREAELDILLTQLATYVSNMAAGNEEKINSAGMEASEEATPPQVPNNPQNLKLIDNKAISGSAKALWKKVTGSKVYLVFVALESAATPPPPPGPPTPPTSPTTPSSGSPSVVSPSALPTPPNQPGTNGYTLYDVCTSSRIVINGLTPGKRIWVVTLAIGAAGKSGFSDPATLIVR